MSLSGEGCREGISEGDKSVSCASSFLSLSFLPSLLFIFLPLPPPLCPPLSLSTFYHSLVFVCQPLSLCHSSSLCPPPPTSISHPFLPTSYKIRESRQPLKARCVSPERLTCMLIFRPESQPEAAEERGGHEGGKGYICS